MGKTTDRRRPCLLLLCAVTAALLVAGCATCPKYEATVRAAEEGAVASGWLQLFPLLKVVVMRVDGKCRLGWDAQRPTPLLVDPGVRVLEVRGVYMGLLHMGSADVELTADLRAGHVYRLRIERDGRLLTFWLEDEATGAAVSERRTEKAGISPIIGGPGSHF